MGLEAAPFFVLRTPFEPWSTWSGWSASIDGLPPGRQLQALRAYLLAQIVRPEVVRAIRIASPDLVEAIPLWQADPESEYGGRIETSLVRYFSRLCCRPTPFGLFAGCTAGEVGQATCLVLAGQEAYRSHSRLDMEYLAGFARALERLPEIRDQLRYRPNSSLYSSGDRFRYVETCWGRQGRGYRLVALEATDAVRSILEAAGGGLTARELAERIPPDAATRDEALAFVGGLVEAQALVSDLEPPLTGLEPVPYLLDWLNDAGIRTGPAETLSRVQSGLEEHDETSLAVRPPLEDWARELAAHHPCPPISRLFQVDLFKPAITATLGEDLLGPVQEGILLLRNLFNRGDDDALRGFRAAFEERYGDREVPLLVALDEEIGIGFEAGDAAGHLLPLLQGLQGQPDGTKDDLSLTPLLQSLLPRITEAAAQGVTAIRLQRTDLEPFFLPAPHPLPGSFSVLISLALEQGRIDKVHLNSIWGPPGTALLGRFCHGDRELTERVRQFHAREEQQRPDVRFAEIVHLPEDRFGNVILRPLLRGYEIPYLGGSGVADARRIQPGDLQLSLRANRLILRQGKGGPEVIPRLTSAHHFRGRNLGTYQFLCELAGQDGSCRNWDWGGLACLPFLPRLEVGRLVLAKATWLAQGREVAGMRDLEGAALVARMSEWTRLRRIPRYALLVDGDNKMPVDFGNPMSVRMFLGMVANRDRFRLEEVFPEASQLPVRGPEGAFAGEIVLPFLHRAAERGAPPIVDIPTTTVEQLGYLPGSEWLYLKFYSGPASVDRVLLDLVRPWVQACQAVGLADRWFFVRYRDPDWHLRVRVHGDPGALLGWALTDLQRRAQPMLEANLLWKLQLDTYFPECQRYGTGPELLACERLFTADSEAVLAMLADGLEEPEERWRLGLLGMDLLLTDLGFQREEKREFLESRWRAFFAGCGFGSGTPARLGIRFRAERRPLAALLNGTLPAMPGGAEALYRRSRVHAPILAAIDWPRQVCQNRAESLIHMHLNRLLRTAQRAQEAVLYHFLARHYREPGARPEPT
jgi:thiopeptide-type bacteriocin biosynthesis protein